MGTVGRVGTNVVALPVAVLQILQTISVCTYIRDQKNRNKMRRWEGRYQRVVACKGRTNESPILSARTSCSSQITYLQRGGPLLMMLGRLTAGREVGLLRAILQQCRLDGWLLCVDRLTTYPCPVSHARSGDQVLLLYVYAK